MAHGKQYLNAVAKVDAAKRYNVREAISFLQSHKFAKFDETVEFHLRLGVDARKADENVRGTVVLPHGLGKTVRVLVFAAGEKEKEARDAGADIVGLDELIDKIAAENFFEYDIAIATPDAMKKVSRIGKMLGPKGLMPNPKAGTVTMDIGTAVREFKAGKVEYRLDKTNNLHVPIGKLSFAGDMLEENALTLIDAVLRAKPSSFKGIYVKNAVLTATMSPGLKLDLATLAISQG